MTEVTAFIVGLSRFTLYTYITTEYIYIFIYNGTVLFLNYITRKQSTTHNKSENFLTIKYERGF